MSLRNIFFGALASSLLLIGALIYWGASLLVPLLAWTPGDLATRPWREHTLVKDELVMDVPWPLNAKETGDSMRQSRLNNGIYLLADCGMPDSTDGDAVERLDHLADSFVEIMGRNAETWGPVIKKPTTVAGQPAIELEFTFRKNRWFKRRFHGLFFYHQGRFCQIHLNSRLNQPVAEAVWKRIKESIRPPAR